MNLNSTHELSRFLFGGTIKVKEPHPVLNELGLPQTIKSGQNKGKTKTKLVEIEKKVKGLGLKPSPEWETKRKGIYQTDDKVLSQIKDDGIMFTGSKILNLQKQQDAIKIANLILKMRHLEKLLSTYYNGVEDLVYSDETLKTQFQSVLTPTGRLSSKSPNLQNVPGRDKENSLQRVKEHFVSRFEDGVIVNSDYKTIEVVVFAVLADDPNLQDLFLRGIDVYKYIASFIYEKDIKEITPEERNSTKPGCLGIIYGNGAKTLAQSTGNTERWCKLFISKFYTLFPVSKEWHTYIQEAVKETGRLKTFTGQEFRFKKKPAKYEWQFKQGILESYNPPDIKNWSVQGTAFCILIIMLGAFWRHKALHNRDKYLLINTVHDSVMLDCRQKYIEDAKKDLEILVKVKQMCYKVFKYNFKLDIGQDVTVGDSWYNLK